MRKDQKGGRVNLMMPYLALYLRLSQDDVDKKSNALKDESDSIHSQRLLIKRYIAKHPDLADLPIKEFADDGYTGTNFNRPQFQEMLSKIRSGEICCVIVKDLSRFGRNYIEVGDYLEHIFPFLKIRFIAVNDNYDSNNYIGTTGGIDIAFRNFIYQRYSRDLSEKVKSAMHMKMSKGKYVTHCPYGYTKKPGVKHQMVLDPVTAPIVREIFLSVIGGMKSTQVATMLNERKVLTPMEYKKTARRDRHSDTMWSHQAVLRIIKDYKYTGAMVNFKCENETIRASAQRRRSPDEWVIIENSHEAIVTHKEYEAANAALRKGNYTKAKPSDLRDRVYYCACCGRRLRKTYGSDEYYSCATPLYRKSTPCAEIRWSRTAIEEVVLAAYKGELLLMNEEYRERISKVSHDPVKQCREALKKVSRELEGFVARDLELYEQYRSGALDRETFLIRKNAMLKNRDLLKEKLVSLQKEEEASIAKQREFEAESQALRDSAGKLARTDEELKELMYDDIDKIIVHENNELEIQWKFNIQFQALPAT